MKIVKVKHENGLEGVLYGSSSLSIFKDDKEIFHTGYSNIKSKEELSDFLGKVPGFYKRALQIDLKDL